MSSSSTISSKGQITVPAEVRRRLGVKPGDRVEFAFEQGKTVLRPARKTGNPFAEWAGAFPGFSSKEEINAWIRDMRGEDVEGESGER